MENYFNNITEPVTKSVIILYAIYDTKDDYGTLCSSPHSYITSSKCAWDCASFLYERRGEVRAEQFYPENLPLTFFKSLDEWSNEHLTVNQKEKFKQLKG